jgi:hypothetical protein
MKRSLLIFAAAAAFSTMGVQADESTHFTASDGTRVTVTSGQPAPDRPAPPPAFEQLDANRDGIISRGEAESYIPLLNDYDYISFHGKRVSRAVYDQWVRTQGH